MKSFLPETINSWLATVIAVVFTVAAIFRITGGAPFEDNVLQNDILIMNIALCAVFICRAIESKK